MKKEYVKPQMNVHAIKRLQLLSGSLSDKMVGKIGTDDSGLKYAGVVEEDDEETIDPD
jgi:hypothetical protein